ncbi:GH25 family lysozyme [Sharpea porci]|uniref:GH25 family lysozyme n=1 Tax=Sharpea porci TaxID=2652286 RepID=UPI002A9087D3|nr:GH25 family lysozyme [Sharpea porci]MDY5279829.1 GH25 family lysozyme [Sharpea porci]
MKNIKKKLGYILLVPMLLLGTNMSSINAENTTRNEASVVKDIGYNTAKVAVDVLHSDEASNSIKNDLESQANQLKQSIDDLNQKDSESLAGTKKVLDNVIKSLDYQKMETKEALKTSEEKGVENSYRYINGQHISNALEVISKETGAIKLNSKLDTYNVDNMKVANIKSKDDVIKLESQAQPIDGIDVSYHNGKIDWAKVKAANIKFAIIRCGYGKDYTSQDDKKWEEYIQGCEANNIPYGVYLYSYATSLSDVDSEIAHTLRLVKSHKPTYPIYYDLEDSKQEDFSEATLSEFATRYCTAIADAGYQAGVYANYSWFKNKLTSFTSDNRFSHWIARYYNNDGNADARGPFNQTDSEPLYQRGFKYDLWQYTSNGQVNGISTRVDMNYCYTNLDIVWNSTVNSSTNGLVQARNGNWYYLTNGNVNWNYSGLIYFNNEWFYVHHGLIDWNYSNLVNYNGQWFYVHNGKIDWGYNTLSQVDGGGIWYKVTNGKLDWNYKGLFKFYDTWYYLDNGQVDWNANKLVNYNGDWYYVVNGAINWKYTNLDEYNGTWYYIRDSKIRWGDNTLAQVNDVGVWYQVNNSSIDWNYTGLTQFYGTWYYIDHGRLNWNYNGLVYYNNEWFYVKNGRIDWSYSTVTKYNGILFYVHNGKIDWSYNGNITSDGQTYTIRNAKVVA